MITFRLCKREFAKPLNGIGAAKFGNRWNSKGVEIIYTSESRALAMAEVAVHLSVAYLPTNFVMVEIEIPNNLSIGLVEPKSLPENWNLYPPLNITQTIGDKFIMENSFAVLKVPSAVVQGDYNFLINPNHKDFKEIKISKIVNFPFDKRLFPL